jgi:hypothetical protein
MCFGYDKASSANRKLERLMDCKYIEMFKDDEKNTKYKKIRKFLA